MIFCAHLCSAKTDKMPDKKYQKRFVLNDETVTNSYGFSIVTKGINLNRFKKNPVMLDSHDSRNAIGRWKNVEVENVQLTGEPEFDTEDEQAMKVAGKVERGFVNGCSMGVAFDPNNLKLVGKKVVLTACELYEASIVAVPSNANAVRLYSSETGKLLQDSEVKELCLSVVNQEISINQKTEQMKITLTPAAALALGFGSTTEVDAAELSAKIETLETARSSAVAELSAIKQAEEKKKIEAIQLQVKQAVERGKIPATKTDEFVQLGVANPELLTGTLEAIPAKQKFGADLGGKDTSEVKTADDFQKLSLQEQLAFKANYPNEYLKMFN